ncbi:mitochondrial large subunit ribosomal protein-domain-containing protein [Podospora australis]|uniref:Large ribosomal subunit protein mL49 n=1 Tax=Podospora australis TaxID=1536484 RepID=A0AAN7AHP3_9PEZI|nr:mitochondrial large subunit ribosomal protein-domain-containing protein [Podospora australis]
MLRPTSLSKATASLPTRCLLQPQSSSILSNSRRFLSTETTTQSTPEPVPSQSPETSAAPEARRQALPFSVGRTPSKNYSIYELAKRGGNKKLTTIKKVVGNPEAFKEYLARGLKVSPNDVKLNSLTGHFQVAGHRKKEIEEWLSKHGI